MSLRLAPCDFRLAVDYIERYHRHHPPPQGWKFGLAAIADHGTAAVVTVGRPVARGLDDGITLEVTRLCTDGTKNAASFLYAAAWRATRALGYERLITYTLKDESGKSLTAAGWRIVGATRGGSWSCPSRPRVDRPPMGQKTLWEAVA